MNPVIILTILLFLLGGTVADIGVQILGGVVNSTGEDVHFITDEEAQRFGQTIDNWHKIMFSYESTLPPCRVYVDFKDPTNWFYVQYAFKELKAKPLLTTVKFVNATILTRTTVPEIVATQNCINLQSNASITCTFSLTSKRSNTVSASWKQTMGVSLTSSIGIDIGIFNAGIEMEVSTDWEKSTTKEETVEIGTELSATTIVPPLHNATAYLTADRGTMRVLLDYEATYGGSVLVFCLYGLCEDSICAAGMVDPELIHTHLGVDNTIRGTQEVDIAIYANAAIEVRDTSTGKELSSTAPGVAFIRRLHEEHSTRSDWK